MRIFRDFVNNNVNWDNNYTNDELLVLMELYKGGISHLYEHMFDYDDAIMQSHFFDGIIDSIQPTDHTLKFDAIIDVMNVLGVNVSFPFDKFKSNAVNLLGDLYHDGVNISIHSAINDSLNFRYTVFQVGDKYVCRFIELNYCNESDDFYSVYNGYKVFASSFYGVYSCYTNDFRLLTQYYTIAGFIFNGYNDCGAYVHPTKSDSHIIYRFNDKAEYDKAEKLFDSKPLLFKQTYKNHIVKCEKI